MRAATFVLTFLILFPISLRAEEYIGIIRQSDNISEEEWSRREAEKERAKAQQIEEQRAATVRLQKTQGLQPAAGLPPGAGNQAAEGPQTAQFQELQRLQGQQGGNKKKDDYDEKNEKTAQVLSENIKALTNGDQERYTKELDGVYQQQLNAVYSGNGNPVTPEFRKVVEKKMKRVE